MHYLIGGKPDASVDDPPIAGTRVIADGDMVVMEGPWALGASRIARVDSDAALAALRTQATQGAFAVEGLAEAGDGEAFVVGAHRMRDVAQFRPYAERVADVVQGFGGRFLARAGRVTPIAGTFVPDRAVVIEFPRADDAFAFYTSDVYAPLLKIRFAATDPRFAVLARSGELPARARDAARAYLGRLI
jgi:uncharacterized protein (DUF1330 family)